MRQYQNIRLIKWFNFFTDLKLYGPVAVIYFAQITDSFALAMSVFSVVFLSAAFFEIPTGYISDFIGRKNTLIFGAVSAVIFTIFYAIGISFWILIVGAVFEGLSRAFYSGNNEALIYDSLADSEKENFGSHLGKSSAMLQVALALSAFIGSILASKSFSIVLWLSVIPQIICLLIGSRLYAPLNQHKTDNNLYLHFKEAIALFKGNFSLKRLSLAMMLNRGIAEAAFDFQAAFYQTIWPVWAIGFAKMLSYIGAALSFYYSSKLIKKFGEVNMILFRHIINRILFSIALLFPNNASPLIMSSGSLLYGAEIVATQSLAHKEYSDKQRATMGSLVSFGGSIIFAIAAVIMGAIADSYGPAKALFIGQLTLVVVIFLYWSIYRIDKKHFKV